MANSQNGYPVLAPDEVAKWVITTNPVKHLILRPGHAGFVLAHFALYHHEVIESLNTQAQWDDWGYAVRNVRGSETVISNHSSGTAADLNATEHPLGVRGTYSAAQVDKIHRRLKWMRGVLRWGGDYINRADEMHYEINKSMATVTVVAKILQRTKRGKRIMQMNPHYKK